MTEAFLALTKGQGHTTKSNVTDMEVSAFSEWFLFYSFNLQKGLSTVSYNWKETDHSSCSPRDMGMSEYTKVYALYQEHGKLDTLYIFFLDSELVKNNVGDIF